MTSELWLARFTLWWKSPSTQIATTTLSKKLAQSNALEVSSVDLRLQPLFGEYLRRIDFLRKACGKTETNFHYFEKPCNRIL